MTIKVGEDNVTRHHNMGDRLWFIDFNWDKGRYIIAEAEICEIHISEKDIYYELDRCGHHKLKMHYVSSKNLFQTKELAYNTLIDNITFIECSDEERNDDD